MSQVLESVLPTLPISDNIRQELWEITDLKAADNGGRRGSESLIGALRSGDFSQIFWGE